jgi:hypothetical protein
MQLRIILTDDQRKVLGQEVLKFSRQYIDAEMLLATAVAKKSLPKV